MPDARVERIHPPGPPVPGQRIDFSSRRFGRRWSIRFEVERVDPTRHELQLLIRLPLGIQNHETIACAPLDGRTRVQFAGEFTFSPGWRGWLVERLLSHELERGPEDALARLKRADERAAAA